MSTTRELRELMDAPYTEGEALRAAVHRTLRRATGAVWVGSWGFERGVDGEFRFAGLSVSSDAGRTDTSLRMVGRVGAHGSSVGEQSGPLKNWLRRSTRLTRPHRALVNQFRALDEDVWRSKWEETPVWAQFYAPLDVCDQVRLLVYSRQRFVCWLGCLLEGRPSERFSARTVATLKRLAPLVSEAMVRADALDRSLLPASGRHVAVLNGEGQLESASEEMERWCGHPRRGRLLRELCAQSSPSMSGWLDGWRLEFTAMVGPHGRRWLLEASQSDATALSRLHVLSPRQQEVAELLVVGATYQEIGAHLGVVPDTVKFHARAIYAALDVSDRAELIHAAIHDS